MPPTFATVSSEASLLHALNNRWSCLMEDVQVRMRERQTARKHLLEPMCPLPRNNRCPQVQETLGMPSNEDDQRSQG